MAPTSTLTASTALTVRFPFFAQAVGLQAKGQQGIAELYKHSPLGKPIDPLVPPPPSPPHAPATIEMTRAHKTRLRWQQNTCFLFLFRH